MRPSTIPRRSVSNPTHHLSSMDSIVPKISNNLCNSSSKYSSANTLQVLGKRPRSTFTNSTYHHHTTKSTNLLSLSDETLLRIFYFICDYRRPFRPPRTGLLAHVITALPLACCNRRLLRIFHRGILATIDAVSSQEFLDPLARCDDRFHARHPTHLCRVIKLATIHLQRLVLPMYDSTMEDAHWDILEMVEQSCPELSSLSFVDSPHHSRTTPLNKQTSILHKLLPRITNLQLFIVRQSHKVHALASSQFHPKRLALYKLDPSIHADVVKMLSNHTKTLVDLALSFDGLEGVTDFTNFCQTVMRPLSKLVSNSMDQLATLQILSHPLTSPAATLQGPSISSKQSRREFYAVSKALQTVRSSAVTAKPLKSITLERFCPNVAVVLEMFEQRCAAQSEISIYLHEVLIVSPRKVEDASNLRSNSDFEQENEQLPYFLATALHSSSWMLTELPSWYFRKIQHIRLHADEEAREDGNLWFDRMFPSTAVTATPDMRGFKFLCEHAGPSIRTIIAKIPTESVIEANTLFRILSNGLSYAKNVQTLVVSADLLKFVGLDHRLLFAVIGQLRFLEEMVVDGPAFCDYNGAQLENLPVLLNALRICCSNLQTFKLEILADVTAAPSHILQQALSAVRQFEMQMPGVITNNLVELLEVSLKGSTNMNHGFANPHEVLIQ